MNPTLQAPLPFSPPTDYPSLGRRGLLSHPLLLHWLEGRWGFLGGLYGPRGAVADHYLLCVESYAQSLGLQVQKLKLPTFVLPAPSDFFILEYPDSGASAEEEESLFHFLNQAKEVGARVLLRSGVPLSGLPVGLLDLKTRLRSGFHLPLLPEKDEELSLLLETWMQARAWRFESEVPAYLLNYYSRDAHSLVEFLSFLEKKGSLRPLHVHGLKVLLAEFELEVHGHH